MLHNQATSGGASGEPEDVSDEVDVDGNGRLNSEMFREFPAAIDRNLRSSPATTAGAQRVLAAVSTALAAAAQTAQFRA